MKIIALICRILLGLIFIFFGVNAFHPMMPMQPMPDAVAAWFTTMVQSGWMPAIAALQIIGGLLVLIGGTLPLGLCILCPITVNILLFHLCLTGGHMIAPGGFTAMLELALIFFYRANFNGILTARATPSGPRV